MIPPYSLLLFVAFATFAGLAPFFNHLSGRTGLSPMWVTLLRTSLAFVFLAVFFFPRLSRMVKGKDFRYWLWCALLALTGLTLPFQFLSWSVQNTKIILVGILVSTIPLMVLMFSLLGFPTSRANKNIPALICGFLGVCLLLFPRFDTLGNIWLQEVFWGNMAALVAAAFFAFNMLLIEHAPIQRTIEDSTIILGMGALLSIPILLLFPGESWMPLGGLTLDTLLALIALAIISTAIPFVCLFFLIEREGPLLTAQINYLSPLITTMVGIGILGEYLSWKVALGCAIILGSLFYQATARSPRESSNPSNPSSPSSPSSLNQ